MEETDDDGIDYGSICLWSLARLPNFWIGDSEFAEPRIREAEDD